MQNTFFRNFYGAKCKYIQCLIDTSKTFVRVGFKTSLRYFNQTRSGMVKSSEFLPAAQRLGLIEVWVLLLLLQVQVPTFAF